MIHPLLGEEGRGEGERQTNSIFSPLQRARAGDGEELASQARHWMDAPIHIVRLRETWSGVCFDANGEAT
jgi:hypothetical protein